MEMNVERWHEEIEYIRVEIGNTSWDHMDHPVKRKGRTHGDKMLTRFAHTESKLYKMTPKRHAHARSCICVYIPVEICGRKALARGGTRQLVSRGAHTRLRMGRDQIGWIRE
jgi:hypothetical protein